MALDRKSDIFKTLALVAISALLSMGGTVWALSSSMEDKLHSKISKEDLVDALSAVRLKDHELSESIRENRTDLKELTRVVSELVGEIKADRASKR